MERQTSTLKSEIRKNPSYKRHKRQFFWQILAPILVGVLVLGAIGVLVVLSITGSQAGGPVSQWADLSLMWLMIPVILLALLAMVLFIACIYFIAQVLNILPRYTFLVQHYVRLVSLKVSYWSNKAVSPMISIKSQGARIGAFFRALFGQSG